MIVFSGQLSPNSKKYALLRPKKAGYVIGCIIAIAFAVPTVIVASQTHWIFALFLLVYALCPLVVREMMGKMLPLPTKIIIYEEEAIVIAEMDTVSIEVPIENVTQVLDRGECYHIRYHSQEDRLVCQKDLVSGSELVRFEKIFKDKIIVANENH